MSAGRRTARPPSFWWGVCYGWSGPHLKLLRFELGKLPVFLLIYGSFGLGFLGGWLGHALKVRKQKRATALAAEKVESPQAAQ